MCADSRLPLCVRLLTSMSNTAIQRGVHGIIDHTLARWSLGNENLVVGSGHVSSTILL